MRRLYFQWANRFCSMLNLQQSLKGSFLWREGVSVISYKPALYKKKELHMVGMIVKSFKFCTLKPPENKFLHLIFYLKYIHFPYCSSSDFLYTYLTFNFHGICVQNILFSRILKRSLSRRRVWKEKVVSKFF